jgi:FkbM family methyltransferase
MLPPPSGSVILFSSHNANTGVSMGRARVIVERLLPTSAHALLTRLRHARSRSLSQVGQDSWVFGEAFNGKRQGYFLDIGAADGVTDSNTYLLEKRFDWHGICIEPNPKSFAKLARIRSCICLPACVDSTDGEVDFTCRGRHGGIVAENTDNKPGSDTTLNSLRLKTRSLGAILREHDCPRVIDYLSIDVEGAEDRILSAFPFAEYRFNCLTVERPGEPLRALLTRSGYLLLKEIPTLDCFYIHSEFLGEYVRSMFDYWMGERHPRLLR